MELSDSTMDRHLHWMQGIVFDPQHPKSPPQNKKTDLSTEPGERPQYWGCDPILFNPINNLYEATNSIKNAKI